MKVLGVEEKTGAMKVRIDRSDDLWYLHQVLREGDTVGALAFRRPESREDQVRPESQPRVKVFLKVRVESIEFHPFTDALRVGGAIVLGPDGVSGHHTFSFDVDSVLEIERPGHFSPADLGVLEEAEKGSLNPAVIIVTIDDEGSMLFRVRDYGLEDMATVRARGGGKRQPNEDRWGPLYGEIIKVLEPMMTRNLHTIIMGPGFFKDELGKALRCRFGRSMGPMDIFQASGIGKSAVMEVFGSAVSLSGKLSQMRHVHEISTLAEFFRRIGKGAGAAYGEREVIVALDIGAVEVLLISERVFREGNGNDLATRCSQRGSDSLVISLAHEQGAMFDKMGGLGALLRFDIK